MMNSGITLTHHQISTWFGYRSLSAVLLPRKGEKNTRFKKIARFNTVNKGSHIIRKGISFENILSIIANLRSETGTT